LSGGPVLALGRSHLGERAAALLAVRGVEVVAAAEGADERALPAMPLAGARALLLASDDEHLNLRAALLAAELAPGLRIVIRIFDAGLARALEEAVPGLRALSASQLAAPSFAAAALSGPRAPPGGAAPPAAAPSRPGVPLLRRLLRDRVLAGLVGILAGTLAVGTLLFSRALGISALDAAYFVVTTLTTTGYGDIALRDAPPWAKLAGMALMLGGVALVAAVVAIATDALLRKREDLFLGRRRTGARDHVVVCGAGDVGFRVVSALEAAGAEVLVIERDPGQRRLEALRALGHAPMVTDATRPEALRNAGVGAARALVAATDDDLRNLEIALAARALSPGLHVVLRIFDRAFARRIEARFGFRAALSSSELAAPAFVAAALGEPDPR
jgi:voltage-gated potassium channel Kch